MVKEKFILTEQADVDKVVSWVKEGREIKRWISHDLGAGRPDMMTPGDAGSPHWAYPESHPEDPENIVVELRTPIILPREKGTECDRCNGTGKRSVHELAAIREESVEETRQHLKTNSSWGIDDDGDTFNCNMCNGRGYNPEKITFRVKKQFWGGYKVSDTGIRKCDEMTEFLKKYYGIQLPEDIRWDWCFDYADIAYAMFYKVTPKLLTEFI